MPQDNIAIVEKQFPNDKFLPEVVRLLDEGYTVTLRLKGYSMRPFLENNRDKALLVKARDIKKETRCWLRYRRGTMCCTALWTYPAAR